MHKAQELPANYFSHKNLHKTPADFFFLAKNSAEN